MVKESDLNVEQQRVAVSYTKVTRCYFISHGSQIVTETGCVIPLSL